MGEIFPQLDEGSLFLSRNDHTEVLGTFSAHSFFLDDDDWPTLEHYFQAMKFEDRSYRNKIQQASSAKKARKLGRARRHKLRADWSKVKNTVMTRGLYIKCRSHPEITEKLLSTENRTLVENSQYDYYWGCGRDRRGSNHYGHVMMNVRNKLREEANTQTTTP